MPNIFNPHTGTPGAYLPWSSELIQVECAYCRGEGFLLTCDGRHLDTCSVCDGSGVDEVCPGCRTKPDGGTDKCGCPGGHYA